MVFIREKKNEARLTIDPSQRPWGVQAIKHVCQWGKKGQGSLQLCELFHKVFIETIFCMYIFLFP